VGWYRKRFTLSRKTNVRLVFGGGSHTAKVWIDGKAQGEHYDAFTPWDVIVRKLAAGEHEVVVRVDNQFGDHSALHIPNDYYTYGGISRPVELQEIPDVFIDKLFATPKRGKEKWTLQVKIRLRNAGKTDMSRSLRVQVAGQTRTCTVEAVPGNGTLECELSFKGLKVDPWSETSPRLYDLTAELVDGEQVVDDKRDRVGFREVKVEGDKLLLNGKEVHLRGFNRHEDHPDVGCAVPPAIMAKDLAMFRDLNCNFLRTCHYPNDMRILDMCDELGIYVWEESHSRQTPFDHPKFEEQIRTSTIEMVENHYNRPCIITWGSLNECDTRSKAGYKVHKKVMGLLRELDDSRPVTYAANHRKEDLCLGLVDIVSWNLYTGWYGDPPEKSKEVVDDLMHWLDSEESHGGQGKPVILSEFGGGGIYGCRHPQADFWTEEYQEHVLSENLKAYLNHPRIVGAAIWQFCDVRVSRERNPHPHNSYGPIGRPRNMNNKGVVDEFRRPKLAYATVRKLMGKAVKKRGKV
jgi:beta-glucuronidase